MYIDKKKVSCQNSLKSHIYSLKSYIYSKIHIDKKKLLIINLLKSLTKKISQSRASLTKWSKYPS